MSGATVFQDGPLLVRRLADPDVAPMARWLSDPRVLEFYGGRDQTYDPELVREEFFDAPEAEVQGCLVAYDGRPIGYIQFYALDVPLKRYYAYADDEPIGGMDLFIGETDYWGRGIGTRLVTAMAAHMFAQLGALRVTIDPQVRNPRAIRTYARAGFVKVRDLPAHELHEGVMQDCWLLERANPAAQPPPLRMSQAQPGDGGALDAAVALYQEAVAWTTARGLRQWARPLPRERFAERVARGELYLAWRGPQLAGTLTLQEHDRAIWGEPAGAALYVHGLAVARALAGQGIGRQLLAWAERVARATGRQYVRLDCDASNPALRAYYAAAGFAARGVAGDAARFERAVDQSDPQPWQPGQELTPP